MQRRKFFKFLGLGTAAAAGGAITTATLIATSEKSDAVKKIEEAGFNGKLTLGAEYGERVYSKPTGFNGTFWHSGPQFVPGTRQQVKVNFAVGPDGNLYLHQNGKWGKVVVES